MYIYNCIYRVTSVMTLIDHQTKLSGKSFWHLKFCYDRSAILNKDGKLVVETFLHGSIPSGVVTSEHQSLGRRLMDRLQLFIVGSHDLQSREILLAFEDCNKLLFL